MIRFRTSGWRGVIAEDFTFATVRVVARAIAEHLLSPESQVASPGSTDSGRGARDAGPQVVVGYDTRFQSEAFAAECAKVLCAAGIRCHLTARHTPTPVLAHSVRVLGGAGGINITASHKPPEWNGLKFSGDSGGPALPAVTDGIARRANQVLAGLSPPTIPMLSLAEARTRGLLIPLDPAPAYIDQIRRLVDLAAIRAAGLRVAVDLLHGTGGGYLDALLREAGCDVEVLHAERNPAFGGHPPVPAAEHLGDLARRVVEGRRHLGLACGGDADRFGILDADGTFIEPNVILALVAGHLLTTRDWPGGLARSVATTHLLDRVATRHGRSVHETPVGFTYIGELITQGAIVLGGEESACMSVRGHVPEKDAVLACLLVAELVAASGRRTLKDLLHDLYARVGTVLTRRITAPLDDRRRAALQARLGNLPPRIAGRAILSMNHTDGVKLLLEEESWILVRPSGTEPMVRLYIEATSDAALEDLEAAGRALFL